MGLIQNKVKVSQPNSHVVVKNAGGLRGLTGEQGVPGPQGVPGQAATVTAGTTTTLPAGSDATVQNVGSTSAAIFNFGIPQGEKGDTGETGAAATISVGTTTTLDPGEDATVTNSGTSSAAVFDFGIPKGAKGDTGNQGLPGQDGADGFSPTATVSKTGDTATITITDKDGTTTAQISDGVTPTIDPALSPTSENPVQNKVVTNALAGKADKPIVVSSLPATGTEGQEYFVDDRYNTVTELKGDTEQTTYSGKNLVYTGQRTDSGLTWTYDSVTGIGNVKGTAGLTYSVADIIPVDIPSGTFTASIQQAISNAIIGVGYRVDGGSRATVPIYTNTTSSTKTLGGTKITTLDVYLTGLTVGTYYDITYKIQFESGSTATSFEPYVGGTASPNPDYPQEVQTVTGEQTVTVMDSTQGKNIWKLPPSTSTVNDVEYTPNGDGTFDLVGLASADAEFSTIMRADTLGIKEGETYTFSTNGSNILYFVFNCDVNGTWKKTLMSFSPNNSSVTATCPSLVDSYVRLVIRVSNGTNINQTNVKSMLEKGSLATSFVPYAIQAYPINLGKNLFDKDNVNTGALYVNGPTMELATSADLVSIWIPCFGGETYTIQKLNNGTNQRFRVWTTADSPAAGVAVLSVNATDGTYDNDASYTVTTPSSARYLGVLISVSATTPSVSDIEDSIQIEKGSTATDYAPYFTPIELCKIGDYQDYIYKSGEDWYVHKEIGRGSLDGSEAWNKSANQTNGFTTTNAFTSANTNADGYSDYFIYAKGNAWQGIGKCGINQYYTFWCQMMSDLSLADFKTWLTNNTPAIYYTLTTATDTQITDATLIAQLEALAGAKIMVDGGTATVTSQYLPATLTTEYNSNSGYIDYIYDGTNFVKVR